MKITDIEIKKWPIKLKKPFKIASGLIDSFESILVKITTDAGIAGFGEGAPLPIVTGETTKGTIDVLNMFKPALMGHEVNIEQIHKTMDSIIFGNPAAKCAVDIAIYDIIAKSNNKPLYKYLGADSNSVETDITIGIDSNEIMLKNIEHYYKQGFKVFKIKVGLDFDKELALIQEIDAIYKDSISLRLDANQGWGDKSVEYIALLKDYNIELIEQPVNRRFVSKLNEISTESKIPIFADESVFDENQALEILKTKSADGINIKLMKTGGIYKAKKIADLCSEYGKDCIIGCMMESRLALSAAAALSASHDAITKKDLDTMMHIKNDNLKGCFEYNKNMVVLSDGIGLGLEEPF